MGEVNYRQPHNIFVSTGNVALDSHLVDKSYRAEKFRAKFSSNEDDLNSNSPYDLEMYFAQCEI
jgi:hypothetical protein